MFSTFTRSLCVVAMLGVAAAASASETRFHQYTRQYDKPKSPATPLSAGYIGSQGDETLSGAAILPNGTVLLAGTAYGPSFDLPGVKVVVVGDDAQAPAFTMTTNKKGRVQPPTWSYTAGAGFIVQLAADHGSIVKAVRFPWGSGFVTDIVADESGALFVTGLCGPNFSNLTTSESIKPAKADGSDPIFLARMKPDLSGFMWSKTWNDDKVGTPRLQVLDDGRISLIAQHGYHFDSAGTLLNDSKLSMPKNWVRGVNPVDHASMKGGDGNTKTGYEPWRQPRAMLVNAEGEILYGPYSWSSKLVGTNWSRLVSDSSYKAFNYDRHGNLLISGWSDGGNTVFERLPYDLTTSVSRHIKKTTGRNTGLDFSTWGAGVGSFCHLVKIDAKTGEPIAKTLWSGYLADKNKPNGAKVTTLDTAADNSLLIGGSAAWGLIETGSIKLNTLDYEKGDYIGGKFIAVLNDPMNDIRFSSAIPGSGVAELTAMSKRQASNFATRSAQVGDKVLTVFVSGATFDEKFKAVNPAQKTFGGGAMDGLYVVLSMEAEIYEQPTVQEPEQEENRKKKGKGKDAESLAGEFNVSEGMYRPWTVINLADPNGSEWPLIYLGQPKGEGTVDASGKGSFTISGTGDQLEQSAGLLNDKRLAFNLARPVVPEGKRDFNRYLFPTIELDITITGATTSSAVIQFADKSVKVNGSLNIRPSKPAGKGINLSGRYTTTLGALGIGTSERADDPLVINFWVPGRPLD